MKTEKEIIREFQNFRKGTKTCNAIRLDEVAQFVQFYIKDNYRIKSHISPNRFDDNDKPLKL